eukprot:gene12420-biopygen16314
MDTRSLLGSGSICGSVSCSLTGRRVWVWRCRCGILIWTGLQTQARQKNLSFLWVPQVLVLIDWASGMGRSQMGTFNPEHLAINLELAQDS